MIYTDEMLSKCADVLKAYWLAVYGTATDELIRRITDGALSGQIKPDKCASEYALAQGAVDVVIATARALKWPRR